MGGGGYSVVNATTLRSSLDTANSSIDENFTNRQIVHEMDPIDITLRESRDSEEHPNSLAIILGLDVTASMGSVPQMLVREGLPKIMGKIIQESEPDPQMLFVGLGDHECDQSPLQVGQFESSDDKLDHWLMNTFIERGGGGNNGESYLLAWYFAAMHTSIDCFDKRGRKGLIITIGDEPPLVHLPSMALHQLMGTGQYRDWTAAELLVQAEKTYDVYHIHVISTPTGMRYKDNADWIQLLGPKYVTAQTAETVADMVIAIVANHEGAGAGITDNPLEQNPSDELIL